MISGRRIPAAGFRPPPHRRRRKTFSASFSGRVQKCSPSPDLPDPHHHALPRASPSPPPTHRHPAATPPKPPPSSPSSSHHHHHLVTTPTPRTIATTTAPPPRVRVVFKAPRKGCVRFHFTSQGCAGFSSQHQHGACGLPGGCVGLNRNEKGCVGLNVNTIRVRLVRQ
ncbi:hypothetical protein Tco_1080572 [Tanacetum coccineum]|uniref:Uncharacterized protein n=1 Tax=Tanacetum coccineum TaxID=301880 RepID=A0ABQ5HV24_9ASTR